VTTGTKAASFAGESKEIVVTTVVTMYPGKPFMQIAAVPEPFQCLLFDRTEDLAGGKQFIGMPDHALIEGTLSGIAGAVDLAVLAGESIHARFK
jgi:hypothetical protein